MITAQFTTGHVDVYKGKRPVKAAWLLTGPNGDTKSGHSLDRAKARSTAEGAIRFLKGHPHSVDRPGRGAHSVAYLQYWHKLAREHGFKDHREFFADYQVKAAAFRATCKIEVVDL